MILIGLDVHKHSLTAVAVDELGRPLGELSTTSSGEMLAWSERLARERLWALEDCRHVTRRLEQTLCSAGERLVRVPPRLTAPQRRSGRTRGKSDPIDALAVARAALREPWLDRPRPEEARGATVARAEAARGSPRRPGRRAAPLPARLAVAEATGLLR